MNKYPLFFPDENIHSDSLAMSTEPIFISQITVWKNDIYKELTVWKNNFSQFVITIRITKY